jgi:hypothetical protein
VREPSCTEAFQILLSKTINHCRDAFKNFSKIGIRKVKVTTEIIFSQVATSLMTS